MEKKLYSRFELGDMVARYIIDENGKVELQLVPLSKEKDIVEFKFSRGDSLVQAKILGDVYAAGYAGGVTMRNNGTLDFIRLVEQKQLDAIDKNNEKKRTIIETKLTDGREHYFIHRLGYTEGDYALDFTTEFINESDEQTTLEMLSSFSIR